MSTVSHLYILFGNMSVQVLCLVFICFFSLILSYMSFMGHFPGGSVVKNPPAIQETQVQSLGWEDPLEKEMATHSSILN